MSRSCPCGAEARPREAHQTFYRGVICQVPEGHGWQCDSCKRAFIADSEVKELSDLLEAQRLAALEANDGKCLGCWYCSGYRGRRPCFNDLTSPNKSKGKK